MRRPGYLIAAAVLALIAAVGWYLILGPGWIERTGWDRTDETAGE